MGLEILAGAGELIDGGLLATEMAGSGKLLVPSAAIAGGMSGLFAKDMKSALIYSAAGGGIMGALGGPATPARLVMAALTSAAVGAITQYVKQSYTQRIEEEKQVRAAQQGIGI